MGATPATGNFSTLHANAVIGFIQHIYFVKGLPKAWPTSTAVELGS